MTALSPVQLRRVFKVVNGGTPTADAENWDGDVPWVTPMDLAPVHGGIVKESTRTLTPVGLRSGSSAVPAGSLIVSTRAPVGYVAEVVRPTAFNQGCRGLVPLRPVDIRYFRYQLLTLGAILQSRGQGSTFVELSSDSLASTPLTLLTPGRQRAIADYLDTETTRIDALIDKKRKMIGLLEARCEVVVEQQIRGLVKTYGAAPLKYATRRIEVGIVITPSTWYAEPGVLALRGLNVRPGRILLDDVVRISEVGHHFHQKSRLHTGDVVVVRTGQAGAAAVIPSSLEGCNCIDLVIVRPSPKAMPKFLEFVLNSDWTQKHIGEHSVGTIQNHFNVGAMKEVPVPVPPLPVQLKVAELLSAETRNTAEITGRLSKQIDLLGEHRKALITAAVTGELEVPGVAA